MKVFVNNQVEIPEDKTDIKVWNWEQYLGSKYPFGGYINICFLIEVMAVDDFQKKMWKKRIYNNKL